MKSKIIYIFTLLFFAISASAEITQEQALSIIYTNIDTVGVDIYISKNKLNARQSLHTMVDTIISPSYSSWLIFVDEHPFANWSHECKYVFVNVNNGNYEVLTRDVPPLSYGGLSVIKQVTFSPEKAKKTDIKSSPKSVRSVNGVPFSCNNYAVIISGGGSKEYNNIRYWNDCSFIYKTLINDYNYDRSHIYVLMSDGTNPASDRKLLDGTYDSSPLDLDNDGTNDIQYAATRSNLQLVFNELSSVLTQEDDLFIYTIDHGYILNSHSLLNLWGEIIYDYEFANLLSNINAHTISVVMGQCNSGGFIDDLSAANRVVMTACTADQSSWPMNNLYYDEFVYYWTSAMAKKTPSGNVVNADANSDGCISMEEAFLYAQNNDTKSETPQYSSSPVELGQQVFLNRIISIQGPSLFCDTAVYSLENVPSGATVQWIVTPTTRVKKSATIVRGQGTSQVTLKRGFTLGGIKADTLVRDTNIRVASLAAVNLRRPYSGNGSITAVVTFGGESYSVSADFTIPSQTATEKPVVNGAYNSLWYVNVSHTLSVRNCDSVPNDKLLWEVHLPGQSTPLIQTGRSVTFTPKSTGTVTVIIANMESCSASNVDTLTYRVIDRPSIRFVNPATAASSLDVAVSSAEDEQVTTIVPYDGDYTLELWSELLGCVRRVEANEPTTQISLSGLPTGIYFIKLIIDNELVTTKQLIVR